MDQDELKKYLLKIGDLVLDEEKIVTYKFLSRTLDIHVNTAKQLLHTFLLQQEELAPESVSATYLIAGLLKDESFVVSIVSGDNLNDAYSKFDIITSEHVYSVQKGKASSIERNSEILYVADSNLKHCKSCVIKCDEALEEDTVESSFTYTQPVEETVRSDTSLESEKEKTEEKCERKTKENGIVKQSPQKDKKKNSISHFFNNHSQRKKPKVEESVEERVEDKERVDTTSESSRITDEVEERQTSNNEKARAGGKVKEKQAGKAKGAGKKKIKDSDSKKRKRILSDSEESESDEERQDAMLCTETEISQNAETLIKSDEDEDDDIFRHKKKKKKFVDKTVLREDGYMETIKEVVYETDSESELQTKKKVKTVEKEPPKSSKPQEPAKKIVAASKTNTAKKQQTLLSFFKKN